MGVKTFAGGALQADISMPAVERDIPNPRPVECSFAPFLAEVSSVPSHVVASGGGFSRVGSLEG